MTGLEPKRSWGDVYQAFKNPKVVALLFLGLSAGIPILLIFSTLSVWLREAGVSRATIGFFSWAALGYAFKFIWAPLIDKLPVPWLAQVMGRRRSWLLLSQLMIIGSLFLMATSDPAQSLTTMALFAVLLGFSSATQDIVIDAYRIEVADVDLQGIMSSAYIAGYRIGMLVAGAGALELAGFFDGGNGYSLAAWSKTYVSMAAVMGVGVLTTLAIAEPVTERRHDANLQKTSDYVRFVGSFLGAVGTLVGVFLLSAELATTAKSYLDDSLGINGELAGFLVEAVRLSFAIAGAALTGSLLIFTKFAPKTLIMDSYLGPFTDFFSRHGKTALLILALISTYRIADVIMGVMANVFYVDLGFDKQEIGRISKGFGLVMTLIGGFAGGALAVRYGVMKSLMTGAILAAASNLLFALLAQVGDSISFLMLVISADNLSAGIASAAFVAYLSSLTSSAFTATQYALFSSIMVLLPKILAGYSGVMVESVGYEWFFVGTAAMGVPVLFLIYLVARAKPPG
ncbi:MAG: MFS transporter [Rhodospirillales bacterium]|nr:MFS transporter [Rhodospirillales bacterium]